MNPLPFEASATVPPRAGAQLDTAPDVEAGSLPASEDGCQPSGSGTRVVSAFGLPAGLAARLTGSLAGCLHAAASRGAPWAVVLASLLVFPSALQAQPSAPPAGFTALFNGKDLAGWHGLGHFDPRELQAMSSEDRAAKRAADRVEFNRHWRVENGELINDGAGPYATTDQDYGDVELLVEYRTVAGADSGIYLRGTPQVQIWDSDKGSGGLWNNSPGAPGKDPLALADKPVGEWNRFRILQVGDKTTVHLNDRLVVDHATMENFWDRTRPLWPKGPIQLQTHGGEIRWRNLHLREIPAGEANALLQARDEAGFESLFNGSNLSGWGGPIYAFEVNDGAIVCKPDDGGTLYTRKKYSDFVLRLEFKAPSGGEAGLAIRYPGSGHPAYVGMCRIQILDESADPAENLDPRKANGAAYGMIGAHSGFLRPPGQWNFEQVTVEGSTIKVELNGVTILEADLGEVTEFMDNHPHPGRERSSGHLGLIAHTDPVQFRNLRLKPLP